MVSNQTHMECAQAIRKCTYKTLEGGVAVWREYYENEAVCTRETVSVPVIMIHSPFSSELELREIAELNGFAETLIIRRLC